MWKILQWFSNKPPYYCTHREKSDPQFWECTYVTRAGNIYLHTIDGRMNPVTREALADIIQKLKESADGTRNNQI